MQHVCDHDHLKSAATGPLDQYLDVFSAGNTRTVARTDAAPDRLWVKSEPEDVARSENDHRHHLNQQADNTRGNLWFIFTLWLATMVDRDAERRLGTDEEIEPVVNEPAPLRSRVTIQGPRDSNHNRAHFD